MEKPFCTNARQRSAVAADIIMQLFDDVLGLAGVLALLLDLVAGVHDGGMVAFEYLCNIREGVFKLLPDHVHCHLPRVGQIGRASCRERV